MLLCFVLAATSQQQERFADLLAMGQIRAAQSAKKFFPGTVGTKIDFSGFEPCSPRRNNEHRQEAQEILNQT